MTRDEEKAKRWKPWQFSLRLLMLITLVISAFLGGWQANEFNRSRKAVPAKIATPVSPPTATTVTWLSEGDFEEAALFRQFQMPIGERRRLAEARNQFLKQQRSLNNQAK